MARRFRVSDGKVAIWEGHTDLAPFNDPLNPANIGRVKFHSDIPYVKIVDVKTFTVTIPALTNLPDRAQSYFLGAHGRPGQPVVIGRIVVNGVPVAFTGSVPVHQVSGFDSYARFLVLGADASNLYIHEYAVQNGRQATNVYSSRPEQTFAINCYITDILL
jgi:hypothetical protein